MSFIAQCSFQKTIEQKNHAPYPKKMTWMKQSHAAATLDYHKEQATKNKNLELIDTGYDLSHLLYYLTL